MSVKINGHTIASKLRKMFSSNGQTVASNLDGEIPSGGGSALVVTFSGKDESGNSACDKTFEEIKNAGTNVKMLYSTGFVTYELNIIDFGTFFSATYYHFDGDQSMQYGAWSFTNVSCGIASDGTVNCTYIQSSSD